MYVKQPFVRVIRDILMDRICVFIHTHTQKKPNRAYACAREFKAIRNGRLTRSAAHDLIRIDPLVE